MTLCPAIFLDRDGVIIENRPDYVRSWDDVEIYPQALQALASIRHCPHKIVIVTNQSGVGRGLFPLKTAIEINRMLVERIEQANGRIDAVFMCPHAPEDECLCRKPKPGLLMQAAEQLGIDLSSSIMIGDALTDLKAGQAAGVPQLALLRTGRGLSQSQLPAATQFHPLPIYDTLAAALSALLRQADCRH